MKNPEPAPDTRSKKRGRPKKKIDATKVEELAAISCSLEEIATILRCSVSTLQRNYDQVIKRGRAEMHVSLRRRQFETAMGCAAVYNGDGHVVERERPPNCTMLIFLGKVHLGQVEAQHLQVAHSGDMTVRHDDAELTQLLEDRVAGIAARIRPDVADACANGDAPGAGL